MCASYHCYWGPLTPHATCRAVPSTAQLPSWEEQHQEPDATTPEQLEH